MRWLLLRAPMCSHRPNESPVDPHSLVWTMGDFDVGAALARIRPPRHRSLFRDPAMARADGSLRNLLARLSRIDVLVIDDWAMAQLSEPERRDFWEICEDRYQVRSTILTSQLLVSRKCVATQCARIGEAPCLTSAPDARLPDAEEIPVQSSICERYQPHPAQPEQRSPV